MAFACNECHRTWPDKDNQLDDANEYGNDGLCPECADDEDDDGADSGPWSGGSRRRGRTNHGP